jgi:hypothetical protein
MFYCNLRMVCSKFLVSLVSIERMISSASILTISKFHTQNGIIPLSVANNSLAAINSRPKVWFPS